MGRKYRSLEERLRLYEEVMRLRRLGLGYKRIAKVIKEEHGVSLSSGMISNWINGNCHPLGRCNKIVEGPGLAYAVCAWLGDGRLARDRKNREYCVKLAVKDYDFAEEWGRRLAEALGRSKPYVPRWSHHFKRWIVRGRSALLYSLLKRAKEDPWILLPYLEKYPAEACRGFFDAEGGVNQDKYEVYADNTDPRIIQLIKTLLEKIGIQCSIYERRYESDVFISPDTGKCYHRNKPICYRIQVHGKENILKFAEQVGFTIARKRAGLAQILQRYNRLKIPSSYLEKVAKALIATNLRRLGLMTRLEAARLFSIHPLTISSNLHGKTKTSKLLKLTEVEELSKEYFRTRSDEVIKEVQKILEAIVEIYNGHEAVK